jgi:DNA-binding Xre family transcriptional regulator
MLYTKIHKVLEARGIKKPVKFLQENGFSRNSAYNITALRFSYLRLNVFEKLCIVLSCSPNDLLEWQPNPGINLPDSHPLHKLKPKELINVEEMLKDIPAEKFAEFKSGIDELKAKLKQ